MNRIWKSTLILLAFLVLGLLIHFGFFESILKNFSFLGHYNNSVLTVNTRRSNAKILLNGVDYGQTPQSITNLPEGEYLVELERVSETPIYLKESFFVELHSNTEAVVDIEIAPEGFKSGHILYYTPIVPDNIGAISMRGDIDKYDIFINKEKFDSEDLLFYKLKPKEYTIEVSSEGYESLEFPVIVREGYNLNIRVYLLPIPVSF